MSKQIKPLSAGLILTPIVILLIACIWVANRQISYGAASIPGPEESSASTEPFSGEAVCGNGLQEAGEQCDSGTNNGEGSCRADCTSVRCGDSIVDESTGEQCDNGSQNGKADNECSLVCEFRYCGDGFVGAAEQCDDQNQINGDGCDNACVVEKGYVCSASPSAPSACSVQVSSSSASSLVFSSVPASAPDNGKPFSSSFSSSAPVVAPVTSGTNASMQAVMAAYAPVFVNIRQIEPSFDSSLVRIMTNIVQGRALSNADAARVPVLSTMLDAVIQKQNEQDPYFIAMTELITPFTEDIVTGQGINPLRLSADLSSAALELSASKELVGDSIQSLATRVAADTRFPALASQQSSVASLQKNLTSNTVATLQNIATLATTLSAHATPRDQLQATVADIADNAASTQAQNIAALYPGVSSADLTTALSQVHAAAASADTSPAGISAIIKSVAVVTDVMKKGGVDISIAPTAPSTAQFMTMAASLDGKNKTIDSDALINAAANTVQSHEAQLLRNGTPVEKISALSAWADSRTPSILQLIKRLPDSDQAAAAAQLESVKEKLQMLSENPAKADQVSIRAAIEEMGAYTTRLEMQAQKNFSAFDRFVDFFQRNVFHISA